MGGSDGVLISWTFEHLLLPLQSAFFSLLAFFLLSLSFTALRVRSLEGLLFAGSSLLVILGMTPVGAGLTPFVVELYSWLLAVPVTGAVRGMVLGIALGTLITGMRLLWDGQRYFR
jgi:hypothetical protein